ncbi:MAG: hypothetical protein AB1757_09070 [Acidobacteriota bacterium]
MKRITQIIGIIVAIVYSIVIIWLYVRQPRSFAEIKTQAAVEANIYSVKQENFDEALKQFNTGHYEVAIAQFKLADPAQRDALTQFYIAYGYYLLGRGRISDDDELFRQGLAAIDKCLAVAPNNIFVIDRADFEIKNAGELRARFHEGLAVTPSDFNPFNWFKSKK